MLVLCQLSKLNAQHSITTDIGIYVLHQPRDFYKTNQPFLGILYADIVFKKIHLYPRYNFDLLKTGSLNIGYNLIQSSDNSTFVYPSIGFTWGVHNGYIVGLVANHNRSKVRVSTINMYLGGGNKITNNWYSWSELSFLLRKGLFAGASSFIRQFDFNSKTYSDFGLVVSYEQSYWRVSIYPMNLWAENRYYFLGLAYNFEKKLKFKNNY